MAAADTAKMIVELDFKSGKFMSGIKSADASLGKLETRVGRMGGIASRGLSTLAGNVAKLGVIGAGAVAGLLAVSVKEGQEAAKVQAIYAQAIANSGKVSAEYVRQLDAQQAALMNLAGVDDELIKAEQTKLIQMGLTGKQVADLTPLILDMSKATGKDLLVATLAAGKAVSGNVGGLARFGVMIDKAKAKVDPFRAVVAALAEKFRGTTRALSGSLEVRLLAFHEGLANIREEIGIKLLPALTRIVDVAGKNLVPAFQKFVDRILPDISKGIDELAAALESGGAEEAIGGISSALSTMIDLLKLAAQPVKAIVGAFMSLPKELQGILIAGFAVNKLSGGMLVQLAGGIFDRGSPTNPMWVKDVSGGLGGGGNPLGTVGRVTAGGALAAIGAAGLVTAIGGAIALAMFQVIPRLVNGNRPPVPGAGIGGSPSMTTAAGTLGSMQVSQFTGLMPGWIAAAERAGAKPIVPGGGRGDASTAARAKELLAVQALIERVRAKGGGPTSERLAAIMEKNARASKSGDDRTADRLAAVAKATRDAASATRDTAAAIRAKDFSPTIQVAAPIVNVSTGFTISLRSIATAQRVASTYNVKTGRGGGGRIIP